METRRPVVMAKAERVDFESDLNHRRYSISVALPLQTARKSGCPVLYVLDGDCYLGSAVEAVRSSAPGVAVVGIGYPDQEDYVARVLARHQPLPDRVKDMDPSMIAIGLERMFDLSLPVSDEAFASAMTPGWKSATRDFGGLDALLEVLEADVKPRVANMVSLDSSNQALFGYSLGGLAVVHALFTRPNAFRTFVAASPSIWWNDRAVLRGERRFATLVRAGATRPRVLVTVGGEEQAADPQKAAQCGLGLAAYADLIRKHRMVDNACELVERLKVLRGSGNVEIAECAVFSEQDHGISAWPALGRAVSFAFPS